MDLASDPNIAMLEIATKTLGDLCDSLVFVGGCATGLLLTTTRAHSIRATKDVDVVTKAATIRGTTPSRTNSLSEGSNMTHHRTRRSADGSVRALRLT